MNLKLIRKIKEEMNKTEQTNKYYNLYPYAYSDNFIIRYIFMDMLLSTNNNLDILELYEDDITNYFIRYDDDSNEIGIMPYKYVNLLAHRAMLKDQNIYKQILNFIVNNYIKTPEQFRKENTKITL